jgi:hypothetical protein
MIYTKWCTTLGSSSVSWLLLPASTDQGRHANGFEEGTGLVSQRTGPTILIIPTGGSCWSIRTISSSRTSYFYGFIVQRRQTMTRSSLAASLLTNIGSLIRSEPANFANLRKSAEPCKLRLKMECTSTRKQNVVNDR